MRTSVFGLYTVALACLPMFIQPEGQESGFSEGLREAGGGEGKYYCFQKVWQKKRQKKVDQSKSLREEKTEKGWPKTGKVLWFSKSLREEKTEKGWPKTGKVLWFLKSLREEKTEKGWPKTGKVLCFFKKSERRKDRKRLTKNRASIMFFKKSERRKDRKRLTKNSLSVFVAFLKASSQSGQSFAAVLWSRFWRFCTLRCGFSILFTLHLTRAQVALRLKPVLIFFFFFSSHNLKEAKHAPTPHVRSFL